MPNSQHSRFKTIEYLPLTGSQKWLMGELAKFRNPGWCTIEFLARTKVPMDEDAIEGSVRYLVNKYENLRVRIVNKEGEWFQELYGMTEADAFAKYDFSAHDHNWGMEKMKQICMKSRDWLLPSRGNMFKVIFFKFSESEGRIWFCMHHVISDFVSLLLLSGEFLTAYQNISQGKELKNHVIREYRKWFYLLEGYSRDVLMPSEMDYWISLPWGKAKVLPSDYPARFNNDNVIIEAIKNKNLVASYRADIHLMDQNETSKLISRSGAELESLLLSVFFLALVNRLNVDCLDINVSCSGRTILPAEFEVNTNRLFGFLSAVRAVLLQKPNTKNTHLDIRDLMQQIKSIPNGGVGFYLIKEYIRNEQLRKSYLGLRKQPEILFNYLGRTDTGSGNNEFEIVHEDTGFNTHVVEVRNTLLECVVGIKQNQLFIQMTYSEEYFKSSTIDEVVFTMMNILRSVIEEQKSEKHTPSTIVLEP